MPRQKYPEIDTLVGKKIQAARVLAGLSQGALGDHLDVSHQQVQKYENGRDSFSIGALVHAAAFLQTSVAALLGADGTCDVPDTLTEMHQAMRLGRVLLSIEDARVRRNLIRFVESLAPAAAPAPADVAAPPALAAE